jgi:hypothetical protein
VVPTPDLKALLQTSGPETVLAVIAFAVYLDGGKAAPADTPQGSPLMVSGPSSLGPGVGGDVRGVLAHVERAGSSDVQRTGVRAVTKAGWAAFGFTFAGWLLAAIVVAGLSGIFKRD